MQWCWRIITEEPDIQDVADYIGDSLGLAGRLKKQKLI
mgnify:CR=1 FL=1